VKRLTELRAAKVLQIRAVDKGAIFSRDAGRGQELTMTRSGAVLFTLADLDEATLTVYVPEAKLLR
jgi:hypothetical protein